MEVWRTTHCIGLLSTCESCRKCRVRLLVASAVWCWRWVVPVWFLLLASAQASPPPPGQTRIFAWFSPPSWLAVGYTVIICYNTNSKSWSDGFHSSLERGYRHFMIDMRSRLLYQQETCLYFCVAIFCWERFYNFSCRSQSEDRKTENCSVWFSIYKKLWQAICMKSYCLDQRKNLNVQLCNFK